MPRLPARPFLYAVLDAQWLAGRSVADAVSALARGGAAVVQVRAKSVSDVERVRLSREACGAARVAGVPVIVNDRPDVARIVGAAGVHLGQDDLPPAVARSILGPDAIVGFSTHDALQVASAAAEPVDYVAFGPVFPTRTKAGPGPLVGLEGLRAIRTLATRPLVAIGGITSRNAAAVISAGADGVAVAADLIGAPDMESAARELVAALRNGL